MTDVNFENKLNNFFDIVKQSIEVVDFNDEETEKNMEIDPAKGLIEVIFDVVLKDGKKLSLSFQTSTTYDNAVSSILSLNSTTDDFDSLMSYCEDNHLDDELVNDFLKKITNAQKLYDDYVDENYITNQENFGGLDANSEFDELKRK